VLAWRSPPRCRRCRAVLPEEPRSVRPPQHREGPITAQPGWGITGGHQQRSSDLSADPAQLRQRRCRPGGQPVQFGIQRGSSAVSANCRSATVPSASLVAAVGVTIALGPAAPPWRQACRGQGRAAAHPAPQGGDHQRPQRIGGLGAGLHRRGSGHTAAPHHLDHAVAGLGIAVAWPANTARAAASASTGSDLPAGGGLGGPAG
jgi:hypothetical protein